jgi:hypothetical protein
MPLTMQLYTLQATATFTSGHQVTVSNTIVVQEDFDTIVSSTKTTIYNPINTAWTA